MDNSLKETYKLYKMNRTEFSKQTGIPYKTLEGWESKGLSGIGQLLITAFAQIRKLELEHQEELKQYKDKAERFDVIQNALKIKK